MPFLRASCTISSLGLSKSASDSIRDRRCIRETTKKKVCMKKHLCTMYEKKIKCVLCMKKKKVCTMDEFFFCTINEFCFVPCTVAAFATKKKKENTRHVTKMCTKNVFWVFFCCYFCGIRFRVWVLGFRG